MALLNLLHSPPRVLSCACFPSHSNALRSLFLFIALLICSISAHAQLQSPFVFAADPKGVAVYTRNDVTGILTPVPGSPFPSREVVTSLTLDLKGRYLFTANRANSKISMFTIDPNVGTLQEVPNSPFASLFTDQPLFLSSESSGTLLYVINWNGSNTDVSSVESFQIDSTIPASPGLIPSAGGAKDLPGLFQGGATHPSGAVFYAYFNNPSSSNPNSASLLVFNSSTGAFTSTAFPASTFADALALDPQAQRVALASGNQTGVIATYSLLSDGTLGNLGGANAPIVGAPAFMTFDTLGQFLYVTQFDPGPVNGYRVHIYSASTLQELPTGSPLPLSFPLTVKWTIDPTAPLIFADQVYQVPPNSSPQEGIPASILSTSLFTPPAVFNIPPGSQPIVGPVAQLNATSLSFGSLSLGQTSTAQTLTITSIGGQALSLNTVAIGGANSTDFAITSDTCHAPTVLQPKSACSVLISFTPSVVGSRLAALTITDNAVPSTESASLTGIGLTPAPAVSLVPGTLNFATTALGAGTSLPVAVTNGGTAPLHISGIALGGANAADFSFLAPACNSAIAVNAGCSITVTFAPLAAGLRSSTITLNDDAPDSPQLIQVNGTGSGTPPPPKPAVTLAPTTVSFGPVTQGTTNGPQNITVTNSGAAALHITSVVLGGANAPDYTMTNNCTAASYPVNGACSITLIFAPSATGPRAATITLTDDAPDSPQILNVSGTGNVALTIGPAPNGSTSASVSAGQTAQYNLQLTPGPGFTGTVSLACAGAPFAATCQAPATISVSNGAPVPFTVSVSTSGSASLPSLRPRRFFPPAELRPILLLALALILLGIVNKGWAFERALRAKRLAYGSVLAALLLYAIFHTAGCGGGTTATINSTPPPPPVVTPSGTSTITVTPSAISSAGKPLQLQPIQLTLIVK